MFFDNQFDSLLTEKEKRTRKLWLCWFLFWSIVSIGYILSSLLSDSLAAAAISSLTTFAIIRLFYIYIYKKPSVGVSCFYLYMSIPQLLCSFTRWNAPLSAITTLLSSAITVYLTYQMLQVNKKINSLTNRKSIEPSYGCELTTLEKNIRYGWAASVLMFSLLFTVKANLAINSLGATQMTTAQEFIGLFGLCSLPFALLFYFGYLKYTTAILRLYMFGLAVYILTKLLAPIAGLELATISTAVLSLGLSVKTLSINKAIQARRFMKSAEYKEVIASLDQAGTYEELKERFDAAIYKLPNQFKHTLYMDCLNKALEEQKLRLKK